MISDDQVNIKIRAEPAWSTRTVSVSVKSGSLVRITEDFISLGDLLEPFLRSRLFVLVRVILQGQLPVGLLDLLLSGVSLQAQQVVVILTHPACLSSSQQQTVYYEVFTSLVQYLLALHVSVCFLLSVDVQHLKYFS